MEPKECVICRNLSVYRIGNRLCECRYCGHKTDQPPAEIHDWAEEDE